MSFHKLLGNKITVESQNSVYIVKKLISCVNNQMFIKPFIKLLIKS